MGHALRQAIVGGGRARRPSRRCSGPTAGREPAQPNLYRLATAGTLPRDELSPGLEDWAGEPFFLVTHDPSLAQAMWSFAHGMVILEIDGRYPAESDLERTWAAGAAAFRAALTSWAATGVLELVAVSRAPGRGSTRSSPSRPGSRRGCG